MDKMGLILVPGTNVFYIISNIISLPFMEGNNFKVTTSPYQHNLPIRVNPSCVLKLSMILIKYNNGRCSREIDPVDVNYHLVYSILLRLVDG